MNSHMRSIVAATASGAPLLSTVTGAGRASRP